MKKTIKLEKLESLKLQLKFNYSLQIQCKDSIDGSICLYQQGLITLFEHLEYIEYYKNLLFKCNKVYCNLIHEFYSIGLKQEEISEIISSVYLPVQDKFFKHLK